MFPVNVFFMEIYNNGHLSSIHFILVLKFGIFTGNYWENNTFNCIFLQSLIYIHIMHLADTFRQRDFSSFVFFTFKFIYIPFIQYAQLKNIFKKYWQWIYILFAILFLHYFLEFLLFFFYSLYFVVLFLSFLFTFQIKTEDQKTKREWRSRRKKISKRRKKDKEEKFDF